ncbi:ribonuclease H1-like [Patiria miniata]|uniref:Ribonuclease H1 n=1 Tax=Patiria miniata TaxID=46514 RepID=A0A914A2K8_PATMI|nr:ribonuclease H1-like [Patiria miniata]
MSISRFCRSLGLCLQTMPKFHYAVRSGRSVGVFNSWDECSTQVNGYGGARYKKFGTAQEAWDFVNAERDPNPHFSQSSQPARQYNKGCSYPSYGYKTKRAPASTSYAAASLGSDYSFTPEPAPVFTPEYTHPMSYSNKRKHEPPAEESYSNSYKKARNYRTGSASSYSSSVSSSTSSSPSPSSSSGNSAGSGRAVVYTDGSCESNGRRGARAGVGVYWGDNNPYNTSERLDGRQTNQRAEIAAAIRAVETAKSRNIKELTLYTDSKYTMNSMNDWIHRWKVNGWKTAGKKDVLNKQELQTLDGLCQEVNVDWKYVPGHANIKGNEEADSLARAGARMPPL